MQCYCAIRPMLFDHCLSVLSVMLVYCGQTATWIEMPLGIEVGLGPGHIMLDGDAVSPMERGTAAPPFAVFRRRQACICINRGPCLLWPNGWMDQDATGYGDRPRPRRHSVRWGPSCSPPTMERGTAAPNFSVVAKWLDGSGYHLVWR